MRIDGRAPMVHSVLTPASTATSRQCSPGTRRLPWRGTPAFSGVTFARREARNSRTSFRFSIRETVVGRTGPLGAPDSTPHGWLPLTTVTARLDRGRRIDGDVQSQLGEVEAQSEPRARIDPNRVNHWPDGYTLFVPRTAAVLLHVPLEDI